jgi:hypothetical protein
MWPHRPDVAISVFGLANILRSGQRIGWGNRSCLERVRERQNEKNIATEKPKGVPEENWLPINRKDENLDIVLRIYVPDLEKMKTWTAPKAETR